MKRRVVVTGLGIISPIGNDIDTFWENVKKGTVGIGEITKFDTTDFKVKLAAEVKDFDATKYMDKREARRMELFSQYAVAAAKQAVEDSGLDLEKTDKNRMGVSIGSGVGSLQAMEREHKKLLEKGPGRISPMLVPMMITNMAAGNVAIQFGCKGKCLNIVTACATGTHSIGEAFRYIQYGDADIMLAGGTEASVCPIGVGGFSALTALSTQENPLRASIPFDKERSGFVMGEGAGVVVLEEYEHAIKRGAKIYGEVAGYGATCDAFHITSPAEDGEGAARAMMLAMEDGNVKPEQVEYINAHGTSTPANDSTETNAIKLAFGDVAKDVAISSTKSMTGHLLGAAGAVEAVMCVKALQDDILPPTINYKTPDEECDLDYIPNEARKVEKAEYALSNSLGFGGHNAVLCFKKWGE